MILPGPLLLPLPSLPPFSLLPTHPPQPPHNPHAPPRTPHVQLLVDLAVADADCASAIVQAGAIPRLVAQMAARETSMRARELAAIVLCHLGRSSDAIVEQIAGANAIRALVSLASSLSKVAQTNASRVLGDLARVSAPSCVTILEAGGVPRLVDLMRSSLPAPLEIIPVDDGETDAEDQGESLKPSVSSSLSPHPPPHSTLGAKPRRQRAAAGSDTSRASTDRAGTGGKPALKVVERPASEKAPAATTVLATSPTRAPRLAARSEEQAARLRALLATSQVPLHVKNKFHFFSFQVDPNLRG